VLFSSKLTVGVGMGSGVGMRFSLVARAVFVWRVLVCCLWFYIVCTPSVLLVRYVRGV
jgi:hypothetical protein